MSARGNSGSGSPAASASNLHHGGVFQHDDADHRLLDLAPITDDAVVFQQRGPVRPERARRRRRPWQWVRIRLMVSS